MNTNPNFSDVEWKQGRESVTQGIWMWSKPFVVQTENGKKVSFFKLMVEVGMSKHNLPA